MDIVISNNSMMAMTGVIPLMKSSKISAVYISFADFINMPDQKEVWNSVGEEWHKYRQHPVSEATEFLKNKRGLILDLACGSGRNFVKIDGAIIGVDFSERMLRFARANITKNRYNDVFLVNANAEKLPFQDGVFDTVMLSASLHNIKYNRHRNVLEEINRVSKNKADIFISVWNRDQPRFANAERESYI